MVERSPEEAGVGSSILPLGTRIFKNQKRGHGLVVEHDLAKVETGVRFSLAAYMRRIFLLSVFSSLLFPLFVFAQNPTITSYRASETSIISGQVVSFSWTISDAGGYSFTVPCSMGIIVKKSDGSSFDCSVPVSNAEAVNDSIILLVYNVSGSVKNITGRLTPKKSDGTDYSAGSLDLNVSVQTVAQPITSFTASETDTTPGQPVTVSWATQVISGVNLLVGDSEYCRPGITVSSPSYTDASFLPCGKIVFASDLGPSGSLSFSFSNSTPYPVAYMLKLYPAIVANTSYDGTHAVTLTLNVASDIIPDPIVTYVTASTTAADLGGKVTFSWGSRYTTGVNLKFSCNALVIATSTQNPDELFPCNTYLFDTDLERTGELGVSFVNNSNQDQTIMVSVIPAKKPGVYDALRGKTIPLTIHPVAMPLASPFPSTTVSPSPSSTPLPGVLPPIASPVVCAQDVKRCGDGSYVRRKGSLCAFAACPVTQPTVSGTPPPVISPAKQPAPQPTKVAPTPSSEEELLKEIQRLQAEKKPEQPKETQAPPQGFFSTIWHALLALFSRWL